MLLQSAVNKQNEKSKSLQSTTGVVKLSLKSSLKNRDGIKILSADIDPCICYGDQQIRGRNSVIGNEKSPDR